MVIESAEIVLATPEDGVEVVQPCPVVAGRLILLPDVMRQGADTLCIRWTVTDKPNIIASNVALDGR